VMLRKYVKTRTIAARCSLIVLQSKPTVIVMTLLVKSSAPKRMLGMRPEGKMKAEMMRLNAPPEKIGCSLCVEGVAVELYGIVMEDADKAEKTPKPLKIPAMTARRAKWPIVYEVFISPAVTSAMAASFGVLKALTWWSFLCPLNLTIASTAATVAAVVAEAEI